MILMLIASTFINCIGCFSHVHKTDWVVFWNLSGFLMASTEIRATGWTDKWLLSQKLVVFRVAVHILQKAESIESFQ